MPACLTSRRGVRDDAETPACQPGADDTLVYLLVHDSTEAMNASFDAFRKDPAWVVAKEASEKAAGGSLTVENGVKSVPLVPTDFFQIKNP